MSKNQQWKKAIRAQVAATIQNSGASQLPIAPAPQFAKNASSVAPNASTPQNLAVTAAYRQDLVRIFWVAAILLIALVTATITDQRTGWLAQVATQIENAWKNSLKEQVQPLPAGDTSPVPTLPASEHPA